VFFLRFFFALTRPFGQGTQEAQGIPGAQEAQGFPGAQETPLSDAGEENRDEAKGGVLFLPVRQFRQPIPQPATTQKKGSTGGVAQGQGEGKKGLLGLVGLDQLEE